MLHEAGLSDSFWYWALGTQIHVGNRLPTSALPDKTPHEAWYKQKPEMGHIRVWGCTAYVFVQKDKRKGFAPHMEKCVFLGYPKGYKGWCFYNPTTKKTVISERAEFDERDFHGRFRAPIVPREPTSSSPSPSPELVPLPMPEEVVLNRKSDHTWV